jgi:hypothetical protein
VATVVPFAPGVYAFELTVHDETGAASAPALVRFDVAGAKPLPVALASAPAHAAVGELVMLDGRASKGGSQFHWTQLQGPWVVLDGAGKAPVFTAADAGTYVFELVVEDDHVRSAPVTVSVNVQ